MLKCIKMSRERGFTLIETIIIMVLIIILAAAAVLRWNADAVRLESAVRKVAADIRYAQKLSISSQTRSGIEFTANGYCIFPDTSLRTGVCSPASALASSPGDTCSTDSSGDFYVDFSAPRCNDFSGVTIAVVPGSVIAFDSLGTPVDGVTGTALGTHTITVALNGNRNVNVIAGTGLVSY